jgi:hypothetical protein
MKFTINISSIPEGKKDHWEGIFVSFIQVIEDIFLKKRKGSYLLHFYLERLDKNERRTFLMILEKIIVSLTKRSKTSQHHKMISGVFEDEMPLEFQKIFKQFSSRVSDPARDPHQVPYDYN